MPIERRIRKKNDAGLPIKEEVGREMFLSGDRCVQEIATRIEEVHSLANRFMFFKLINLIDDKFTCKLEEFSGYISVLRNVKVMEGDYPASYMPLPMETMTGKIVGIEASHKTIYSTFGFYEQFCGVEVKNTFFGNVFDFLNNVDPDKVCIVGNNTDLKICTTGIILVK